MMKRRIKGELVDVDEVDEAKIRASIVPDGANGPLLENHGMFDVVMSDDDAASLRKQWADAPPPPKVIDGAEFLLRITPSEYLAVRALERTDGQVALWMDTFRLNGAINVLGETAQAAKAAFVSLGVCTKERADEIFN